MEEPRKPFSISLHVTALILSIIVFVFGIGIGNYLASQVNNSFYAEIDSLQTSNVNLEFLSLLESDPSVKGNEALHAQMCNAVEQSAHSLGVQTADVGRRLRLFEQKRGQGADVIALEQRYFALEARDYLFWKRLKNLCNTNLTLVVYFFKTECNECAPFDAVLADFKKQNPPGILIYSFNLDYAPTTPSTGMLSSIYKVDAAPAIIVNDKKLNGNTTVEALNKLV